MISQQTPRLAVQEHQQYNVQQPGVTFDQNTKLAPNSHVKNELTSTVAQHSSHSKAMGQKEVPQPANNQEHKYLKPLKRIESVDEFYSCDEEITSYGGQHERVSLNNLEHPTGRGYR